MSAVVRVDDVAVTTLVQVLKALADPNRLRIFDRLMSGDSCNCELTEQLALAPNLLSHHLRILRQAGLITARRDALDGRWIYYAVNETAVSQYRDALNTLLDPARIQPRPDLCGPEGQTTL
ncbi:MAG: winged helix-turn-helix transcriptional regulator [Anaerolineales bacterium]|nr:winged helix-turn-helix transcriptional regulator [Anaerolineales bacterium]MCA9975253.1 winged helix-turn-helix transcriptional regulator [Anaerolineales bacterium]MCB8968535.1 winged helix-turn-helix transcriptional regulator [Ardenticatenaceae bacterium]